MKVLFLTQTPQIGAAARYRVYQFIDYLQSTGINCTVSPACSDKATRNLTLRGSISDRILAYSQPLSRRVLDLFRIKDYDIVFLQRDILIHFPPVFEWIISRINNNFIFDFDDALYTQPRTGKYPLFYRLRGRKKIPLIIKMAKYVIAGNRHLKEYAVKFNKNIEIIPTSIDTKKYRIKDNYEICDVPVIGWIGRPGSSRHLKQSQGIFQRLAKKYNFVLNAVGAGNIEIEGVKVINKEWNLEEEIQDIYNFNIGIMPLSDDEWTWGKSATKALQYMGLGIPVVCSAIGANRDIIQDGENGFLARSEEEWVDKLSLLIESKEWRERLGRAGRLYVEKYYSVEANAPKLIEVFKKVYAGA